MEWLHPLSRDMALSPEGRFYPVVAPLAGVCPSPGAAASLGAGAAGTFGCAVGKGWSSPGAVLHTELRQPPAQPALALAPSSFPQSQQDLIFQGCSATHPPAKLAAVSVWCPQRMADGQTEM